MAMGRSKPEPSFFRSAGARLMVMSVGGRSNPEFLMAERTRSRLYHCVETVFLRLDPGVVDFHIDDVSIDAVDCRTERLEEHEVARVYRDAAINDIKLCS
jgi:hypothetical protein